MELSEYKISVSICVYWKDNPEWFDTAVQSVLNQTVPPAEVVLVVDGPVGEELDAVIRKYEKMEIFRVIRLKENQGTGIARNYALQACTHEMLAVMDADDICLPDRFEKQLKYFASDSQLDAVGAYISEFVDTPDCVVAQRVVPITDQEIKQFMKRRNPVNHVTAMCRKASVEAAGGYQDWHYHEDYYLWIRMALSGMRFANIPETLVNVRVGRDMYNRRGGMKCFRSGARLMKYMYDQKFISLGRFLFNVCERFAVQVLFPNELRGWIYRVFARK